MGLFSVIGTTEFSDLGATLEKTRWYEQALKGFNEINSKFGKQEQASYNNPYQPAQTTHLYQSKLAIPWIPIAIIGAVGLIFFVMK